MKTLLVLFVSCLTIGSFAADRKPTVILNGNRDYEIVIDGERFHSDNSINLLIRKGQHSIKVYERSRSIFRGKSRLVSASTFRLWDNDLYINIDRFGNVQIRESRNGNDRDYRRNDNDWKRDKDWNDKDWNDRDRNDRDWNDRNNKRY